MRKQAGSFLFYLAGVVLFALACCGCKKQAEDHTGHDMNTPLPSPATGVYVANEGDGTISVIDVSQNKVVATIHLGETMQDMYMPHNVQCAPDGKTIWVTCMSWTPGGMDKIIIINQQTSQVIRRIDAGIDQHVAHVVFDSTSTYAFVTANTTNEVIQYDARTFTEMKRFNLGTDRKPHGLRYSKGKLYVANMDGMSFSILDIVTGQITEIPLGGIAVQTAITPDHKSVFVSLYDAQQIVRYDVQSQQLSYINLPAAAHGPIQLYATPDSKQLYVCDQGMLNGDPVNNKVYVIDIAASVVSKIITVGYAAHGVVISNDGTSAYVTNSLSNTLSVIDVATQTVKATIAVGKAPNGVSFRFPGGGMP